MVLTMSILKLEKVHRVNNLINFHRKMLSGVCLNKFHVGMVEI